MVSTPVLLATQATPSVADYHQPEPAMISQELLDILACPKCKGEVKLTEKKDGLVCENCKLLYEIREDIPIMLIDEAKKLTGSAE